MVEIGAIIEGKITGITGFGAFVEIDGGKTGLVHISEVASGYVEKIGDHLTEGQEVKVKVVSVEPSGKIALSIKKALEASAPRSGGRSGAYGEKRESRPTRIRREVEVFDPSTQPVQFSPPAPQGKKAVPLVSLEDKLLRFKQDSEEKMAALKRSSKDKRGGYKGK